ncbi:short chain dehydrogenase [Pseudozyma hubeiensis SY62]|uniref:Short chain dehydrogenase n=1 Tax=Pseudozyma hubeiensis (strain SY62) TaxID=1305764 RepID=R9NW50_PSEHS|nr:short chain dehydrogenase [Pseudozyma hubeiensis SY62]GAC92686.1 short chain dehydrogenase [Pseudozyma hubeiensis SY62]
MVGSCQHIRNDLTDCILKTDCYLKQGKSAQECITSHMAELPVECQHLYKSFVECRRGMVRIRSLGREEVERRLTLIPSVAMTVGYEEAIQR